MVLVEINIISGMHAQQRGYMKKLKSLKGEAVALHTVQLRHPNCIAGSPLHHRGHGSWLLYYAPMCSSSERAAGKLTIWAGVLSRGREQPVRQEAGAGASTICQLQPATVGRQSEKSERKMFHLLDLTYGLIISGFMLLLYARIFYNLSS
jgi:hypothetical protein